MEYLEGILVVRDDPLRTIAAANSIVAGMFGYTVDEMLNVPARALLRPGEDPAVTEPALVELHEEARANPGIQYPVYAELRHKNGQMVPIEATIEYAAGHAVWVERIRVPVRARHDHWQRGIRNGPPHLMTAAEREYQEELLRVMTDRIASTLFEAVQRVSDKVQLLPRAAMPSPDAPALPALPTPQRGGRLRYPDVGQFRSALYKAFNVLEDSREFKITIAHVARSFSPRRLSPNGLRDYLDRYEEGLGVLIRGDYKRALEVLYDRYSGMT